MQVELLYFEGCPSWKVADARLTEALECTGRADISVQRRLVETPQQAEEMQFNGSPTIRIDGIDPFATSNEHVGLICRLYETPAGPSGSPTAAQLLQVLTRDAPWAQL